MLTKFLQSLSHHPIVASVKDADSLQAALASDCEVIFVLYGDLVSITEIVEKIHTAHKLAIVHVDLIEGLSNHEVAINFLKDTVRADGVISTKANMVRSAGKAGLIAIHRVFLVDSKSYNNLGKLHSQSRAHCLEILPGAMPKVIGWVIDDVDVPVIAGGLVCEREDVVAAIGAGAVAVSTTNQDVWKLKG